MSWTFPPMLWTRWRCKILRLKTLTQMVWCWKLASILWSSMHVNDIYEYLVCMTHLSSKLSSSSLSSSSHLESMNVEYLDRQDSSASQDESCSYWSGEFLFIFRSIFHSLDWLVGVHLHFHLLQETLYSFVAILDSFLQVEVGSTSSNKLQLVGVLLYCPQPRSRRSTLRGSWTSSTSQTWTTMGRASSGWRSESSLHLSWT